MVFIIISSLIACNVISGLCGLCGLCGNILISIHFISVIKSNKLLLITVKLIIYYLNQK